jgi:hypothetical protein
MVTQRKTWAAVVGVLAFSAVVRADMMPVSSIVSVVGINESTEGLDRPDAGKLRQSAVSVNGLIPPLPWLDSQGRAESTDEMRPVQVLAEGRSSLALCLYALFGCGTFRSLSCVRRLSFGFVPCWYHSGAPAQIGHSLAIAADCSCSTQVCCFIQPNDTTNDLPPQYDTSILSPLSRESLFTPTVLGSRPPPLRS